MWPHFQNILCYYLIQNSSAWKLFNQLLTMEAISNKRSKMKVKTRQNDLHLTIQWYGNNSKCSVFIDSNAKIYVGCIDICCTWTCAFVQNILIRIYFMWGISVGRILINKIKEMLWVACLWLNRCYFWRSSASQKLTHLAHSILIRFFSFLAFRFIFSSEASESFWSYIAIFF